jgi:hypothetical protein
MILESQPDVHAYLTEQKGFYALILLEIVLYYIVPYLLSYFMVVSLLWNVTGLIRAMWLCLILNTWSMKYINDLQWRFTFLLVRKMHVEWGGQSIYVPLFRVSRYLMNIGTIQYWVSRYKYLT